MSWLGWQIDYLLLLQNFRDFSGHILDKFFLTITMFGEIAILVLFICCLYWCINKKIGMYVLWCYTFGFLTNIFLKTTACIYRPWILDSRVHPLPSAIPAATGYSFPSGHTAGAVSSWGATVFAFWENKIIRYFGITLVLLIMISRNYVGVHTPQDVIVSFVVGVCLLFLVHKLYNWVQKAENRDLIITCSVTMLSVLLLLYVNLKSYPMDYLNGKILFDPTPVKIDTFARIGGVLGVFYGWLLEKRFLNFDIGKGPFLRKLIRMVVGGVILSFIYMYGKDYITSLVGLRTGLFVYQFVMGMFITYIYPLIFFKLKI